MIYNNFVTNNAIITANTWNKAWGFEGTAKSLYDYVGAHQYANMTYSAFSWNGGKQQITVDATHIQYSFVNTQLFTSPDYTYLSASRDGHLMNWQIGFDPDEEVRDVIQIQRDGYYIVQCDVAMADATNRIGSSTNADGVNSVPDRKMMVSIYKENFLVILREFEILPNTIKAATGNGPQFVQPYFTANQCFLTYAIKGDKLKMTINRMSGRTDRVVYSSLKAFLIKNSTIPSSEFQNENYLKFVN
jgi:hypothetical protein